MAVQTVQDVGSYALTLAAQQLVKLRTREAGAQLGKDHEELHDLRVALRRLRTLTIVFKRYLPSPFVAQKNEMRWLDDIVGSVRDLDVQINLLKTRRSHATPDQLQALAQFGDALRKARTLARQQLRDTLSSPRYRLLLHALEDSIKSASPDAGQTDLREFAGAAITASYERYIRKAQRLSASSTDEELHEVRKRARRLRYTVEFVRGLYGSPAKRFLQVLVAEQDILGEYQDCTEWLRQLKELGLSDTTARRDGSGSLGDLSYTRMSQLRASLPGALASVEERWLLLQPQL